MKKTTYRKDGNTMILRPRGDQYVLISKGERSILSRHAAIDVHIRLVADDWKVSVEK
jgi:hypothetical protein